MKFIDYIDAKVPTWALSYLVNGDASALTNEDIKQVDKWHNSAMEALKKAAPGCAFYGFMCSDDEGSFTNNPAFGLACDTVRAAIVAIANNSDMREELNLPWENA